MSEPAWIWFSSSPQNVVLAKHLGHEGALAHGMVPFLLCVPSFSFFAAYFSSFLFCCSCSASFLFYFYIYALEGGVPPYQCVGDRGVPPKNYHILSPYPHQYSRYSPLKISLATVGLYEKEQKTRFSMGNPGNSSGSHGDRM